MKCKSLTKNKQGVSAITAANEIQAALDGLLIVGKDNRKVLVTRGNDLNLTVGFVFTALANSTDRTGAKFRFSRAKRGLVEIDPIFKTVVKVTPASLEKYITEAFVLAELLPTANSRVLVLVDKLPKLACQLWSQGRFMQQVAGMFELLD